MSSPWRIDDGNFSPPLEIARDFSFPFSERGDGDTFEYILKYEQDKAAFKKLPIMSTMNFPLGLAYFVSQGNPTDIGNGLHQYDRTFSCVPKTRTEYESASFQMKIITLNTAGFGVALEADFTALTTADAVYEYFNGVRPPPVIAPRYYFAGYVPSRITVQDSEVGIYKGKIYYRKTLYADIANIVFFYGQTQLGTSPLPGAPSLTGPGGAGVGI